MSHPFRITTWMLALVLCGPIVLNAQLLTPEGSPPATRLEQLEAQYNDLLKSTHLPLLKQYLADLQATQGKVATPAETAALKAEIARIQTLITGKGIVDFDNRKTDSSATPKVVRKSGIVFTLDPNEATPLPPVSTGPDAMVPLGSATWKLSALAAGTYDLVAHYACPIVPEGAKVHVSFAGQEFDRLVTPTQITKDGKTFRVMRLCQIKLPKDVLLQNVVVTTEPANAPWLFLKQALIVKATQ